MKIGKISKKDGNLIYFPINIGRVSTPEYHKQAESLARDWVEGVKKTENMPKIR